MDDDRDVIDRLERIERLDGVGAPPGELLDEVRGLLRAAERLARRTQDVGLEETLARCRDALADGGSQLQAPRLAALPSLDRAG